MKPIIRPLSLSLVFALGLSAPALAATYKWKDSEGKSHYGSIPPSDGSGYVELDKNGRVIRTVPSFVEQQRIRAEEKRKAAAQAAALESKRRDDALLASYTSEKEIDDMRDRAMKQEEMVVNGTKEQITRAQEKLTALLAKYKGKKLTALQQQEVDETRELIATLNARLAKQEASAAQTAARFQADKARFIELKGQKR